MFGRLWFLLGLTGLALTLLSSCVPQPTVTVGPVPGEEVQAPVKPPPPARSETSQAQSGGVSAPVIKVLPGNQMPLVDDFSGYPTGAVLPVMAPDRYGMLRFSKDWSKITLVEAFTPEGNLDKAVRLEGGYGEGFLTTGSPDWTDYRVTLRVKGQEACCTESAIRVRLFLDGSGSRALEFQIGLDDIKIKLVKIAGDQSFTLVERPELADLGRAVLRDQNWHDLAFELHSDGAVKVWVDKTEVVSWKDPDYRQGGFAIGPKGSAFFLDDLQVEPLGTAQPPTKPGPGAFCGYRVGAEPPHQQFEASDPVRLALLGGHSAARDHRIGYYEVENPEKTAVLLRYAGAFKPDPVCLDPPLVATFTPAGPFGLVHTYEHYGEKTIYTEDERNGGTPRFKAYEALDGKGRTVGILLLVEDWVDNTYDDVVLLLEGAKPAS